MPLAPTYDPVAVQPLRQELIDLGFSDLFTAEQVDQALSAPGTVLLVLNSVCGCSAGSVRPGVGAALQQSKIPDRLVALFAGQEKEAVSHLRTRWLGDLPPSSPNIILYNNGERLAVLQRSDIQSLSPQEIEARLSRLFAQHCQSPGPSVAPQLYRGLSFTISCGSTIPRNDNQPGSC